MSHMLVVPPLDGSDTFVVEQLYVAMDDAVVAGQPFALVRSERWAWNVPAPADGIVGALVVELGSTVAAGAALIELTDQRPTTNDPGTLWVPTTNDEQIDDGEQETQNKEQIDQNQRFKRPSLVEEQQSEPILAQPRVRATPVARRVAATHGLDLAALSGTGRGNVVTRADVLAMLETNNQRPGYPTQRVPGANDRETINGQSATQQDAAIKETQPSIDLQLPIRNLQFSQPSDIPYALTAIEVDLAAVLATVAQHQARWARRGVTLSATACVAVAIVATLREHPLLNSAWHPDGIIVHGRVQLAIEHHTTGEHQRTLILHAADLNAAGIARRLAHALPNAQIERQAATFVIMEHGAPWWTHALPDGTCTAQLSLSAIVQQPRVVATAHGEEIMVRPTVVLTLAYDTRVATQNEADALLCAIKRRLEHLHSL